MKRTPLAYLTHALTAVILCGPVFVGAPAYAASSPTDQFSRNLSGHIARARERDGAYRAAVASKDAAWQAYQVAAAAMGLKVTLSASSFYTDRTEESRGLSGSSEVARSFSSNQVYLTAKKPLLRRREEVAAEQAYAQYKGAEALSDAAEILLFGRVYMAWMEVLASRDMVQISQDALARAAVVRMEHEGRFQSGEASVDQLSLEISRQEQRRTELMQAETRLDLAERALAELAGPESTVPQDLTLNLAVPSPAPHRSREDALAALERQNPEIIAARFQEAAALLERDKRDADRFPTVDLYALISKGENDTASYIKDERRIGVQVTVPLYTAGAFDASISQAEAEYRKLQALTLATTTRLKTQASSAFSGLQLSLARIESAKLFLESAALRIEAVRRSFLSGTSSYGELARAENEFLKVQQQRALEMLDYAQSWATLSMVTAQINRVLIQSPLSMGLVSP